MRTEYNAHIYSQKDEYSIKFETWNYECNQVEIIGNIYDNPELLEVKE